MGENVSELLWVVFEMQIASKRKERLKTAEIRINVKGWLTFEVKKSII